MHAVQLLPPDMHVKEMDLSVVQAISMIRKHVIVK